MITDKMKAAAVEMRALRIRMARLKEDHGPDVQFWSMVDIRADNDCWEWCGTRSSLGYGHLTRKKGTRKAHRIAYEIAVGPIPVGMVICHRCDNPACCNPSHLWAGSQSENMKDCWIKGRMAAPVATSETALRGSRCVHAKLSDEDVRKIYASTENEKVIAKKFGVSKTTVHNIKVGRTWSHLTGAARVAAMALGSWRNKSVVVNCAVFPSIAVASKALGIHPATLQQRIKRGAVGYSYSQQGG